MALLVGVPILTAGSTLVLHGGSVLVEATRWRCVSQVRAASGPRRVAAGVCRCRAVAVASAVAYQQQGACLSRLFYVSPRGNRGPPPSRRPETCGEHIGENVGEHLGEHFGEHFGEHLGEHLSEHLGEHLVKNCDWCFV